MTWKIDTSHSMIMIIYFCARILCEIITYTTPSLRRYTGKWLCYVALFVNLYSEVFVMSHSLAISIYKYIFIVHQNRIHNFGTDKAHLIAFWAYLIFPRILAISFIARPKLYAFSSVFNCLGIQDQYNEKLNESSKELLQRFLFCGFA